MKTELTKAIRAFADNTTPFLVADLENTGIEIRLYWTKPGRNGVQCVAMVWGPYNETNETCFIGHYRTTGGGYDKEDHVLERVFNHIGFKPRGMRLGAESIPWVYKIGGNFYRVPKTELEKL